MSRAGLFRSFKNPAQVNADLNAQLRAACARIGTRAKFEEMIAAAPEANRGAMRAKMEPLLPANLPCCWHAWNEPHAPDCPKVVDNRVDERIRQLATDGVA